MYRSYLNVRFFALDKPQCDNRNAHLKCKDGCEKIFDYDHEICTARNSDKSARIHAQERVCVFVFVTCIDVCECITHAYTEQDFLRKRHIS